MREDMNGKQWGALRRWLEGRGDELVTEKMKVADIAAALKADPDGPADFSDDATVRRSRALLPDKFFFTIAAHAGNGYRFDDDGVIQHRTKKE